MLPSTVARPLAEALLVLGAALLTSHALRRRRVAAADASAELPTILDDFGLIQRVPR